MQEDEEKLIAGGKVMSLLDHLTELRRRIILSIIVVFAFFIVAMFFSNQIMLFLKGPLVHALPGQTNTLHFTGPLDVFLISIRVSFLSAVVFACPVWLYQFWKFIEPALYERERKFIMPFVAASVGLFVLGISVCFFWVLPMALDFLIGIGREVGTPIITITDYIAMISVMIFGFGFVFEAPLVLILLSILDIVTSKGLASVRRHVIVGVLVVGALLTPPDPISQVSMAIPLYLMYEISIVIIRYMEKKRGSAAV